MNDARVHAAVELVSGDALRLHAGDTPLRFWFAADFDARRRRERHAPASPRRPGDSTAAGAGPQRAVADDTLFLGRGPAAERRRSLSGDRRARLREQRSDAVAAALRDGALGAARAATTHRWRDDDEDGRGEEITSDVTASAEAAARVRPAGVATARDSVDAGSWVQVAASRRDQVTRASSPVRASSRGRSGVPIDTTEPPAAPLRVTSVVSTRRRPAADVPARPYLDVNPPPWRVARVRQRDTSDDTAGAADRAGAAAETRAAVRADGRFDVPVTIAVPQRAPLSPIAVVDAALRSSRGSLKASSIEPLTFTAGGGHSADRSSSSGGGGAGDGGGDGLARSGPRLRLARSALQQAGPAAASPAPSLDPAAGVPTAEQLAAELWGDATPAADDDGESAPTVSPERGDGDGAQKRGDGGSSGRGGGGAPQRSGSSSSMRPPHGRVGGGAPRQQRQAPASGPTSASVGALPPPSPGATPFAPADTAALVAAVAGQRAMGEQLEHIASLLAASLRAGAEGRRVVSEGSRGSGDRSDDGGAFGQDASAPPRQRHMMHGAATSTQRGDSRRVRRGSGDRDDDTAPTIDGDDGADAGVPASALRALLRTRDAQARLLIRSADGEICRLARGSLPDARSEPKAPPAHPSTAAGGRAAGRSHRERVDTPPSSGDRSLQQPLLTPPRQESQARKGHQHGLSPHGSARSRHGDAGGATVSERAGDAAATDIIVTVPPPPASSTTTTSRSPSLGDGSERKRAVDGFSWPAGAPPTQASDGSRAIIHSHPETLLTARSGGWPGGGAASRRTAAAATTTSLARTGGSTPSEAYRFAALRGGGDGAGRPETSRSDGGGGGWATARGGEGDVGAMPLLGWAAAARPPLLAHMPLLPQPLWPVG